MSGGLINETRSNMDNEYFESEYDPAFLDYLQEEYDIKDSGTGSSILEIAIQFNGDEGFGSVRKLFPEIADIYHSGFKDGQNA